MDTIIDRRGEDLQRRPAALEQSLKNAEVSVGRGDRKSHEPLAVASPPKVGVPVHSEGKLIGRVTISVVVAVVDQACPLDVERGTAAEVELQAAAVGQPRIIGIESGVVAMNLRAADTGDRVGLEPRGHRQDSLYIAGIDRIEIGMVAVGVAAVEASADAALDRQIGIELLTDPEHGDGRRELRDALFVVEGGAGTGAEIEAAVAGPVAWPRAVVVVSHSTGRAERHQADSDPCPSFAHNVLTNQGPA